jgi:NADPH:quinone reductase-like Zn-dependent oxidoreductase
MRRAVARAVANGHAADVIEVITDAEPAERPGWAVVEVRAAALNRHDLWSIHGVGVEPDQFPLALGSDLSGVTNDGHEVLVHALIADPAAPGGELLDPQRTMLAEATTGACAQRILVPTRNLVDKPPQLSFDAAACLPTAWLTAYAMLFSKARVKPGQTVLIQGAGGGVSTAAIALARAAGVRVWVSGRSEARLAAASRLGADEVFASGVRLPDRVDVVIETVGAATWAHSMKSVRPGGTIVVAGATAGAEVKVDLTRLFLQHIAVLGSTMGTVDELRSLARFCAVRNVAPGIDSRYPLAQAAQAVARLESGDAVGKVLVVPTLDEPIISPQKSFQHS